MGIFCNTHYKIQGFTKGLLLTTTDKIFICWKCSLFQTAFHLFRQKIPRNLHLSPSSLLCPSLFLTPTRPETPPQSLTHLLLPSHLFARHSEARLQPSCIGGQPHSQSSGLSGSRTSRAQITHRVLDNSSACPYLLTISHCTCPMKIQSRVTDHIPLHSHIESVQCLALAHLGVVV